MQPDRLVRAWRESEAWRLISDIVTLFGIPSAVVLVAVWFFSVPWQAYVLVGLVSLVVTAQFIRRQHLREMPVLIPPAPVPLAPAPSAKPHQEPIAKTSVAHRPPQVPVKPKPSPPHVNALQETFTARIRRELTVGLAMLDRMPHGDADGLAAARALARGEDPPPDQKMLDAWRDGVETLLRGQGEDSLADYFTGPYSKGGMQASTLAMMAAVSGDRSRLLIEEMTARCRLLANVLKALTEG